MSRLVVILLLTISCYCSNVNALECITCFTNNSPKRDCAEWKVKNCSEAAVGCTHEYGFMEPTSALYYVKKACTTKQTNMHECVSAEIETDSGGSFNVTKCYCNLTLCNEGESIFNSVPPFPSESTAKKASTITKSCTGVLFIFVIAVLVYQSELFSILNTV